MKFFLELSELHVPKAKLLEVGHFRSFKFCEVVGVLTRTQGQIGDNHCRLIRRGGLWCCILGHRFFRAHNVTNQKLLVWKLSSPLCWMLPVIA